jgi:hypothetical protein
MTLERRRFTFSHDEEFGLGWAKVKFKTNKNKSIEVRDV